MSVPTGLAGVAAAPAAAAPPPRSATAGARRRRRRQDLAGYLFLLPWFVGMLFTIIPFFASLYLAFTDYNLLNPPQWIGLDNFREMLDDPRLRQSLKVTFIYTFVSVPLSLVGGARAWRWCCNRGIRGLPVYRAVFYLPSLLGGSVAIVLLWRYIFGLNGIVNDFLGWFGIDGPAWTTDPDYALTTLIILHIWTFGSPMVIFLAGLRQIPVDVLRGGRGRRCLQVAAVPVDHAAAAQPDHLLQPDPVADRVVPDLHPGLRHERRHRRAGRVHAVLQPVPLPAGFTQFDMGYASAMAWMLLVIIAAFTAVNFLAAKYWVFYDN